MLEQFTPYANFASRIAIFQAESRHIPNAHNLRLLLAKTQQRLLLVSVPLVAIVFVLSLVTASATNWRIQFFSLSQLLFVISMISVIYVDFYAMTLGINSINGEITKGRWDLLRLTGLRVGHLILAKHLVVQLKVWLKMVTVMAIRLASVILVSVSIFFDIRLEGEYFVGTLISVAFTVLAGVVIVLEPIFRMRAFTALSVMVSASTGGGVASPLAGIGVIFGMWIVQGLILLMFSFCSSIIMFSFLMFPGSMSRFLTSPPAFLIGISLNILISIAFYKFVQDIALRRAATRLMNAG